MRRADRLFDVIQALRAASRPLTAAALAEKLEVTPRTIYRDIAALQASRIPIEGAAGVGYVLRRGYDLPPLMFTAEEVDAIALGVRLLRRMRDPKLQAAADAVLGKLATVVPPPLQPHLTDAPVFVSDGSAPAVQIEVAELRRAIHAAQKMRLAYVDEKNRRTERIVWPIAMAYYVDVTLLAAWCELRADYRHFRIDRILEAQLLDDRFPAENGRLMREWLARQSARAGGEP
jgi:predicted DNA-binding transcriptional regulator YafY